MSQKKRISIRFVAEQAGVSTATVSRVLNNDGSVTESTRRKVLQVMEQYRYEAPAAPASKVSKIGVIIVSSQSDYYHSVLGNIGIYLRERGIGVVAMNTEGFPNYLPVALDTLYDSNVQGVILIGCDYLSIKEHLHSKIPHVWIDCNDPPELTKQICQVQSDHLISGGMAAQELIKKGCKKPVVLTGAHSTHRSEDRLNGFVAEFASNGIILGKEQIISLPGLKNFVTESQEMVHYLVTKGMEFDSIFATNDGIALGAFVGAQKLGLALPEKVKLIGFDGISAACTEVLNISCIQQNVKLLTRNACELLLKLIAREPVTERRIIVPTSILPGQTL